MLGMGLQKYFDDEARDAWNGFCKYVTESLISTNYEEPDQFHAAPKVMDLAPVGHKGDDSIVSRSKSGSPQVPLLDDIHDLVDEGIPPDSARLHDKLDAIKNGPLNHSQTVLDASVNLDESVAPLVDADLEVPGLSKNKTVMPK